MPKEQGRKLIAQNRKARHDYHIEDTVGGRARADGHRGEVAARRGAPRWSTGSPRSTTTRRGCTACTSRSTPRAPGPTTPPARAASCCSTAHEIDKIERRVTSGLHAGAAVAVLQGRPRQGRDRPRQGQEDLRQAPRPRRAPGQPARRSRRSAAGSRATRD